MRERFSEKDGPDTADKVERVYRAGLMKYYVPRRGLNTYVNNFIGSGFLVLGALSLAVGFTSTSENSAGINPSPAPPSKSLAFNQEKLPQVTSVSSSYDNHTAEAIGLIYIGIGGGLLWKNKKRGTI